MTLGRCQPGLRGIPGPLVARQPKPPNTSPRDLDLPFRALESAPVSTRADASSLGIRSGCRPSADMPLSRPLPGTEAPFGPAGPTAEHVPPSWFLTTMTACSTREVTGLLHPATDRGFAAFPDARGPVPSAPRGSGHRSPGPFPATRFTPSEDFPRRQPYRVTAAVALLPFHRHPYPIPAEASARHSPPPPKRWEHSTPSTLRRTLCA
jgi:hypothetical protein